MSKCFAEWYKIIRINGNCNCVYDFIDYFPTEKERSQPKINSYEDPDKLYAGSFCCNDNEN